MWNYECEVKRKSNGSKHVGVIITVSNAGVHRRDWSPLDMGLAENPHFPARGALRARCLHQPQRTAGARGVRGLGSLPAHSRPQCPGKEDENRWGV